MKKIMITLLFLTTSIFSQAENSKQEQAKQTALRMIASLTDTIATLVINAHCVKDPMVTKTCCVDLVNQLADALATAIVAKIEENKKESNKESKNVRGVLVGDHYLNVETVAIVLARKIENLNGENQ